MKLIVLKLCKSRIHSSTHPPLAVLKKKVFIQQNCKTELLGKYQAPGKTQRKVVLQRKVGVLALSQMLGCWLYCPVVRLATPKPLTSLLPGSSLELVVVVVEEMVLASI